MLEEDVTAHKDDTSLTPEGIYDLLSSNCDDLLVVDIRPIAEFRGCHMRGAIHFCFDADHPESKRHKAIRFYKEMQRLGKTWFTRVLVVTELNDPVEETNEDTMSISPAMSRRRSKGLEFVDVIKSAPGMKHIVAIWIIDGGFNNFVSKYPCLCISSIAAKREEALFRDATRQIQEYYASLSHEEKVFQPAPAVTDAAPAVTDVASSVLPSSRCTVDGAFVNPASPAAARSASLENNAEPHPTSTATTQTSSVPPPTIPIRSLATVSKYIKVDPGKWPSNIFDGFLYLGDYESACNPLAIKALRIRKIINCTPDRINLWEKRPRKRRKIDTAPAELDPSSQNGRAPEAGGQEATEGPNGKLGCAGGLEESIANSIFPDVRIDEYLRIPVLDNYCDEIANHFDEAVSFIETAKRNSQAVLVHCAQGVSRSVAVVIAYLIQAEGMSLREAYDFVLARRPVSKPNVGFLKQLASLEMRIHGATTMQT